MHSSVRAVWHSFSVQFEGYVHSMYADVFGLITTGAGNLIDPVHLAIGLPWKRPDGTFATETEVREQWQRVKGDSRRLRNLHYRYAAELTTLRLTDEDIDALVERKLDSNERELERYFPAFATYPADAQLGILSMAWAVGPAFAQKFPLFTRSANAGKWWDCAAQGKIREEGADGTFNAGIVPRNKANRLCFENAAGIVAHSDSEDFTRLVWPAAYVNPYVRQTAPTLPDGDTPEQFGGGGASALAMDGALDVGRAATREARNDHIFDREGDE